MNTCHSAAAGILPIHMTLKSGRQIVVRLVTDADQDLIEEGFAHLSEESRYMRFLYTRQQLSDRELDRLTHGRDSDDIVLGAVTEDGNGPVALARFARLEANGPVAEFGMTVVDDFQRDGVGTQMFVTLAQVAERCGITTLVALVHRNNRPMRRLLTHFGGSEMVSGGVEGEIAVPVSRILEHAR